MKKAAYTLFTVCILLVSTIAMNACNIDYNKLPEGQNEYFHYVIKEDSDGKKFLIIDKITELGTQQKNLIIPKEINGIEVLSITRRYYYQNDLGNYRKVTADKIFVPNIRRRSMGHTIFDNPDKKVLLIEVEPITYDWFDAAYAMKYPLTIRVKFPELVQPEDEYTYKANVLFMNNYFIQHTESEIAKKEKELENDTRLNEAQKQEELQFFIEEEVRVNYGYAWIDYLEEGEELEVIPSAPKRDGHRFDGWYLESDCVNKADLTTITKGPENIIFYANWIKE